MVYCRPLVVRYRVTKSHVEVCAIPEDWERGCQDWNNDLIHENPYI